MAKVAVLVPYLEMREIARPMLEGYDHIQAMCVEYATTDTIAERARTLEAQGCELIVSRGLQDILKYGTRAHFGAYSVDAYANTAWLQDTSSEVQDALHDAGAVYAQEGTDTQFRIYEDEYLPLVEESSLEIIDLDDAQTDAFRDATGSVVDWWKSKVGDDDLADRALALVKEA